MKTPFDLDYLEPKNKTSQQVRLLLSNTEFLNDCAKARTRLKNVMQHVAQLQPKITSNEIANDIRRSAERKVSKRHNHDVGDLIGKLSKKRDVASKDKLSRLKIELEVQVKKDFEQFDVAYLKKKEELSSNPDVFKEADILAHKYGELYGFSPSWGWLYTITMYLLFKEKTTPWHLDVPSEVLAAIMIEERGEQILPKLNFGIKIAKDSVTGEQELYLRIFDNTASKDVVAGWRLVDVARKVLLGKKRYYPKKNLRLAEQVADLDRKMGNRPGTDWEKRSKIFGESEKAMTLESGIEESKQRKKIKQTRYSYRRRSDTKS